MKVRYFDLHRNSRGSHKCKKKKEILQRPFGKKISMVCHLCAVPTKKWQFTKCQISWKYVSHFSCISCCYLWDLATISWHGQSKFEMRPSSPFLAATKQLYDWFSLSVCLSVRLSVTPFSPCSHHRIIMKFSGVITNDKSDVHAKGQGQRSRSQRSTPNLTVSGL